MGAGVLLAVGLGAQAVGTTISARAAKQQAESDAIMHEYNAMVDEREAAAVRRASLDEQLIRRKEAKRLGKKQRALYAKAGVRIEGSPMEVMLESAIAQAEDIALLAREKDLGAKRLMSRAGLSRFKAKAAKRAGKLDVMSELFKGIDDMTGSFIDYEMIRNPGGMTNA